MKRQIEQEGNDKAGVYVLWDGGLGYKWARTATVAIVLAWLKWRGLEVEVVE